MTPGTAIEAIWGIWVLSWILAAFWSRPTAKRAGPGAELWSRIFLIAGVALIVAIRSTPRLYPAPTDGASWAFPVLVAAGCLFAWWARLHLGPLWSSNVTRKDNHHIVDTGPYGIVRHPIYSGLIFSFIATAAAIGTPAALAGATLVIVGIVLKARLEE
jgi:protein-S-isoprenylcysteine O-methyltransferase Ste14